MALDKSSLATALIAAAQTQDDAGKAVWTAIASAIDAYVKTATVNVTLNTGTLAAGVMSGPSTAVVTGTATGSLS